MMMRPIQMTKSGATSAAKFDDMRRIHGLGQETKNNMLEKLSELRVMRGYRQDAQNVEDGRKQAQQHKKDASKMANPRKTKKKREVSPKASVVKVDSEDELDSFTSCVCHPTTMISNNLYGHGPAE